MAKTQRPCFILLFFCKRVGREQRREIDYCWKKSNAEGRFLTPNRDCEIKTSGKSSFNLAGNKYAFEKLVFLQEITTRILGSH